MNDAQWFALHAAYLHTPEWKARRKAVLARDRWICRAQLAVCDGHAIEVHHTTYRHWRNEPLFDLVAVCERCHHELTRMDRQNRAYAPLGRLNWTERQMAQVHG